MNDNEWVIFPGYVSLLDANMVESKSSMNMCLVDGFNPFHRNARQFVSSFKLGEKTNMFQSTNQVFVGYFVKLLFHPKLHLILHLCICLRSAQAKKWTWRQSKHHTTQHLHNILGRFQETDSLAKFPFNHVGFGRGNPRANLPALHPNSKQTTPRKSGTYRPLFIDLDGQIKAPRTFRGRHRGVFLVASALEMALEIWLSPWKAGCFRLSGKKW